MHEEHGWLERRSLEEGNSAAGGGIRRLRIPLNSLEGRASFNRSALCCQHLSSSLPSIVPCAIVTLLTRSPTVPSRLSGFAVMAAWYKRKLQEDSALDATMAEVVEYDSFQSIKPPRLTLDTPSPHPPPPTITTHPTTTQRAFASDPSLSMADWQTERAELRVLESCANQSALYIGACMATASTATFVIARQRYQRSRIGAVVTAVAVGLLTGSVTWRVWGRGCAVDFLQSEGRVAERGRRRLREEMSDHPILIEYEEKQRQRRAGATATSEAGAVPQSAKDAR